MKNVELYAYVLKTIGDRSVDDHLCFQADGQVLLEDVKRHMNDLSVWGFLCILFKDDCSENILRKLEGDENLISFNMLGDKDFVSAVFVFNSYKKISDVIKISTFDELDTFLGNRSLRPNKISIVSFGGNTPASHSVLRLEAEKKYDVDYWNRNNIFKGNYASFSQIMNEGISASKNEFIVFLHQNCQVEFSIMEKLIMLACSGFAFASEINFGFFVCTKQLFRKIGLVDERFIGGENEDVDFFFRMKMADLAIYENGNNFICPGKIKSWGSIRGISRTIFEEKWIRKDNTTGINFFVNDWYLSNVYSDEKKLLDGENKIDIEKGWKKSSDSKCVEWISDLAGRLNLSKCPFEEKYINSNGFISINIIGKEILIKFTCELSAFIYVTIHSPKGDILLSYCLRSNWFHHQKIDGLENREQYEIRINQGEDRIYHNRSFGIPFKLEHDFGIRVKTIT